MPLPPLAWLMHEPAVVTIDTDTVHRWGCQELDGLARPSQARRSALATDSADALLCVSTERRAPAIAVLGLARQLERGASASVTAADQTSTD